MDSSHEFLVDLNSHPRIKRIIATNKQESFIARTASLVLGNASAGELIIPKELNLPSSTPSEVKQLQQRTIKIISNASSKPVETLTPGSKVEWSTGFPLIVRMRITEGLEKEFGFPIPVEHWQSFQTVGEITDYVGKRVPLEKAYDSGSGGWATYMKTFPTGSQPRFISDCAFSQLGTAVCGEPTP